MEQSGVYRKCGKMQFECESSCLGKEGLMLFLCSYLITA